MTEETQESLQDKTKVFVAKLAGRAAALSTLLRARGKLVDNEGYDPEAVVKWLEAAADATMDYPELERARVELLESWRRSVSIAFLQLEADLRQLCESRSWRLDGQWPDFVVEYGVGVHLSEEERIAVVGELRCPANLTAIRRALERQVPNLLPRSFSPQRFVESLLRAWEAATESKGGQAPILDVYRWFVIQSQSSKFWHDARVSFFTPVSTDQFRARLSRCLERGVAETGGRELRLLPPLDPKDALFVYQPAERRFGYVGRIEFMGRSVWNG